MTNKTMTADSQRAYRDRLLPVIHCDRRSMADIDRAHVLIPRRPDGPWTVWDGDDYYDIEPLRVAHGQWVAADLLVYR